MFAEYEVDCGKVNWNWCHGICVQLDEIEELFHAPIYKLFSLVDGDLMQVIGFTSYRKFVVVTFRMLLIGSSSRTSTSLLIMKQSKKPSSMASGPNPTDTSMTGRPVADMNKGRVTKWMNEKAFFAYLKRHGHLPPSDAETKPAA